MIKYLSELAALVIFCSLIPLWKIVLLNNFFKISLTILFAIIYLYILFRKGKESSGNKRLRKLKRGIRLVQLSSGAIAVEAALLIAFFIKGLQSGVVHAVFSVAMPVLALGIVMLDGVIRIALTSRQVKITNLIMMIFFWWLPIVNIFIVRSFYKTAVREYIVESDRIELENARAENEICKTKYPIIMVHGIFFRDWQLFNYWGRIPATLIRNGATINYGKQQSSGSVARSAEEIRKTILKVINETGAEKVNLIAHSKGGLDSRYAISRLGMDKYVATLTTINTPHKGCDMVDDLLKKLPSAIVRFIAGRYNGIFSKLGDENPDFMSGVNDLSAVRAKKYDDEMPDSPGVSYRSVMTVMGSASSAGFPLNIGYKMIKKLNGENDGLVAESSAKHGRHRIIRPTSKRGISHGDVIDLNRENITGFDVREFYVDLVSELRREGF